jgi:hypothetical protein
MSTFDNIHYEFTQFNRYLDAIIDPREADNDTMEAKVKEAIIQAYSNGYHDGQKAIIDRFPRPSSQGGEEGGREYYESL